MVAALIFWVLALYGATMLVYQSVTAFQRRLQKPQELTCIVIVQNAEEQIEGTLRLFMLKTAFSSHTRRIVVVDVNSSDNTGFIVLKMTRKHHDLEYVRVNTEEEVLAKLQEICLTPGKVGCIYDLRKSEHKYIGYDRLS